MPNFLQITPFMHVPDIEAAVDFFRDVLGFALDWREGDYAYVQREGCGIRMCRMSGDSRGDAEGRGA